MTPWLLCVVTLALPAAPQHPTPAKPPEAKAEVKHEAKAEVKHEAKAEVKHEAKTEVKPAAKAAPATHTAAQPVDAAARILERLDREFPYKNPETVKPETHGATAASKQSTRGTPKTGVPESRRSSRLTLSWRITLTWPAMQ